MKAPLKARVTIMLKDGVLDPQGEAIRHALGGLGFQGVSGVRQGKVIELDLTSGDAEAAKAEVARMCEGLLANTVIEKYAVEIASATSVIIPGRPVRISGSAPVRKGQPPQK